MKKIILVLFITLLSACSSNNKQEENSEIVDKKTFEANTQISLGYELPTITLETDYQELDINDKYFEGKIVEEGYEPSESIYPFIIIYRYSKDYENTLELANYEIIKYSNNGELLQAENFADENFEFSFVTNIINFKDHDYLSEKFYYEGPSDYVVLEKLYYLKENKINESAISLIYPDTLATYIDDCYLTLIDETFVLPTIYVYCKEDMTIDEYIDYELDYDYIESNYIKTITIDEEEYQYNEIKFKYDNDFNSLTYIYQLNDQLIVINYCYYEDNRIVEMSLPLLKPIIN